MLATELVCAVIVFGVWTALFSEGQNRGTRSRVVAYFALVQAFFPGFAFSVDGAAGAGKDEPGAIVLFHQFKQMQCADNVDLGIGDGILHAFAHIRQGSLMHNCLWTFRCEQLGQTSLIANVHLIERHIGRDIGPFAGSQTIGSYDIVAGLAQPVQDVAAYKSRSARNQYFHAALLLGYF